MDLHAPVVCIFVPCMACILSEHHHSTRQVVRRPSTISLSLVPTFLTSIGTGSPKSQVRCHVHGRSRYPHPRSDPIFDRYRWGYLPEHLLIWRTSGGYHHRSLLTSRVWARVVGEPHDHSTCCPQRIECSLQQVSAIPIMLRTPFYRKLFGKCS